MGLEIPLEMWRAMVEHGRRWAPLEACGIVAGKNGSPTRFYPARNAEQSQVRYAIDPRDLLDITMDLEREGLSLLAIFHTHPATEAYPSLTDVQLAFYPDAVYLILSLADPGRPVLRGFRIVNGRITEVPVTVGDQRTA